ncbi:hypothetical protein [Psychrobacter arcticus]|nr:hypothetical protein [Psychrobacter arcticus]
MITDKAMIHLRRSIELAAAHVPVEGPIAGLDTEVKALQQRAFQRD